MTRNLFGVFASIVVAGALVAAQDSPSPASPSPSSQAPAPQSAQPPSSSDDATDATFVGCLVQGSGPNAYFLDNARLETADKDSKGQRFALDINATPDQIKPVLNSHVRIVAASPVGASSSSESRAPGGEQKAGDDKAGDDKDAKTADADLQKVTVKRITRLANTCPATKPVGD
ncbi:MAG: hypothetical protein IT184_01065 [Acidobacteria bacterium]|nr:hypothetical protein [Acidobacteriota bacterium]